MSCARSLQVGKGEAPAAMAWACRLKPLPTMTDARLCGSRQSASRIRTTSGKSLSAGLLNVLWDLLRSRLQRFEFRLVILDPDPESIRSGLYVSGNDASFH